MKFLYVVTPPYIYHGCYTWKKFWEEKFIPANTRSCGRHNTRKNRETNNGEQYTALEISLKLDCMDNREVTFSGSRDYVGISGKGLTNSLTLRNKIPSKKEKERTDIK